MASNFTEEESRSLIYSFDKLGLKPKTDTPEDLIQWMKDICHQSDSKKMKEIKEEKPFQFPTLSRTPRLSIFSGEKTSKGNEVQYELWKYEVECLCKTDIPLSNILEAVRHSLKGEAGLIVMRMGHKVDIKKTGQHIWCH